MRKIKKILFYFWGSLLLLIVLLFVVLFSRRIPHINYTKIHASSFAELHDTRNVSKYIIEKLPKNITNIHLDYNQSYKSIFIFFNILEPDFKLFIDRIKTPVTPKQNNTVHIFSMSSICDIPRNYVYYEGNDTIWDNSHLEIIYDGNFCYIYSLGDF